MGDIDDIDDEPCDAELLLELQRDMDMDMGVADSSEAWEGEECGFDYPSAYAPLSPASTVTNHCAEISRVDVDGGVAEEDELQLLLTQMASYTASKVQQCERSLTSFDTSEADSAAAASARDSSALFLRAHTAASARTAARGDNACKAAVVVTDLEEEEEEEEEEEGCNGSGDVRKLMIECDALLLQTTGSVHRNDHVDEAAAVADLLDSMVHSVACSAAQFVHRQGDERSLSSALSRLVRRRVEDEALPVNEEEEEEELQQSSHQTSDATSARREREQEHAHARLVQSQLAEVALLAQQAEEEERERMREEEARRALRQQRQQEQAARARRELRAVRIQSVARAFLCRRRYLILRAESMAAAARRRAEEEAALFLERQEWERAEDRRRAKEKERLEKERLEKERLEKERLEEERLEKERLEKERLEEKRLEKERLEEERLEKERLEKERLEEERLEKERLEEERLEKERLEKERLEEKRLEKERLEEERLEKERLEKERLEEERLEKERLEEERLEKERLEKERLEKERLEKERLEKERLEKERLEKERLEKERLEKERLEQQAQRARARPAGSSLSAKIQALWGGRVPSASTPAEGSSSSAVAASSSSALTDSSATEEVPRAFAAAQPSAEQEQFWRSILQPQQQQARPPASRATGSIAEHPLLAALASWVDWTHSGYSTGPPPPLQQGGGEEERDASPPPSSSKGSDEEQLARLGLQGDPLQVQQLSLCVEDLHHSSFLSSFENATKLELNVNRLTELHGLRRMRRLQHLSAKDNLLSDISALRQLPSLTEVHLESNQLSTGALQGALVGCAASLATLNLNTNLLTEMPLLAAAALQKLLLYNNKIALLPPSCLRQVPSLTHLDLGRNGLSAVSGHTLSQCPLLTTLVLSQNKIELLPSPLYLPCLKSLWLSGNRLRDIDAWAGSLQPLAFLPLLDKLFLQDNQLRTLSELSLACCPLLAELDASFNSLACVEDIAGLRASPRLTRLQLQDNPLTLPLSESGGGGEGGGGEGGGGSYPEDSSRQLTAFLSRACPLLRELSGRGGYDALATIRCARGSVEGSYFRSHTSQIRLRPPAQPEAAAAAALSFSSYGEKSAQLLPLLLHVEREQQALRARAKTDAMVGAQLPLMLRAHSLLLREYSECELQRPFELKAYAYAGDTSAAPPTPLSQQQSIKVLQPVVKQEPHLRPQPSPEVRVAITAIQSRVRGCLARRRLSRALRSARYEDDELDDIMNSGAFGMVQDFLQDLDDDEPPPQQQRIAPTKHPHQQQHLFGVSSAIAVVGDANDEENAGGAWALATGAASMVYGDHRRRRSRQDKPGAQRDNFFTGSHLEQQREQEQEQEQDERPSTSMTEASDLTCASEAEDIESSSVMSGSQPGTAHSQRSLRENGQGAAEAAASEWGISDPKVLAMMLKRSKRLNGFAQAKENREREKTSSEYRYQKFVRSAGGTAGGGSFGGKPKTGRQARAAAPQRKAVPAWALGEGDGALP